MEEITAGNFCNLNAYSPSSSKAQSAFAEFTASIDTTCTETPDLRNWFSSYVYQSPELNSGYCFQDSLPTEGEPKDSGLYVEDSEGEEDTGIRRASVRSDSTSRLGKKIDVDGCRLSESSESDHQHQVPEYSDSLLSEPPDIRNWFSSYVYESPALDTAEIGGSLPSTTDSEGADENVTQKEKAPMSIPTKTSVDFLTDKAIQIDDFVKHRELVPCVKSGTDSAQQENGLEDHKTDLLGNPERLFPRGISRSVVEEASADEILDGKFNKRRCIDEADETEGKGNTIDAKSGPGWILPNHKSKQGNSDGIKRGISQYNGFTSAMKTSANVNEKNTRKRKHERAENVFSAEVDKGMTTRKPLMDITNVCSSGSDELAGKWRCPQKTKPCKGPPLKQLRLEKWINRV